MAITRNITKIIVRPLINKGKQKFSHFEPTTSVDSAFPNCGELELVPEDHSINHSILARCTQQTTVVEVGAHFIQKGFLSFFQGFGTRSCCLGRTNRFQVFHRGAFDERVGIGTCRQKVMVSFCLSRLCIPQ
ncbi:hypothetical protein ACROYT_G006827 [Oculina patagonica]